MTAPVRVCGEPDGHQITDDTMTHDTGLPCTLDGFCHPPRQRNEHPGRRLPNSIHTCKARQDARVPSTKKHCPPHLTDTARLALAQGSRGWAHVADSTLRAREERESRHQPSRLDTSRRDRLEVNMFKMGWRLVLSSGLTGSAACPRSSFAALTPVYLRRVCGVCGKLLDS